MKLLRTVRFDMSDERVFERAAAPSEWAVSGAFEFAQLDASALTGKTRQAFANGFLGATSLGRATFATVTDASPAERTALEQTLARNFIEQFGAPDIDAALVVAREETAFIADLVKDVLINTVFTVRRFVDARGELREEFRTIQAPLSQTPHAAIWSVVEDDA